LDVRDLDQPRRTDVPRQVRRAGRDGYLPKMPLKNCAAELRFFLRSSSEASRSHVTCTTRRSPAKGLCPCQELSERRKPNTEPMVGEISAVISSKSFGPRSTRRRPPPS